MLFDPYCQASVNVEFAPNSRCSAQPDKRMPIAPPTSAPVTAMTDCSFTAPRRRASMLNTMVAAVTPSATKTPCTGTLNGPNVHVGITCSA